MTTLGARLRQLRRERGYTLQEVSDGSGLTPSFLSRLERGIVNISVGNLRKVAAFFGVPITCFFSEYLVPRGLVVRAAERLEEPAGGAVRRASVLPAEAAYLLAEVLTIPPGAAGTAPLARSSRALLYLLAGELTCTLAGQTLRLAPGDVLYQRRPAALHWSSEGGEAVVLAASLLSDEI